MFSSLSLILVLFSIVFYFEFSLNSPNYSLNFKNSNQANYINKNISSKTVNYAMPYRPFNLDPGLCGTMDGTDIINNTFEGLFRVIEKDNVSLGVVKSFSHSKDKKTYIFDFKDNLFWSDGKKVLPKDFEFAWKRTLNKNFLSPKKNLFLPIKNAKEIINNNKDSNSLGVTALNDFQLKVELEFPIDYLLKLLSLTAFMPVREDIVDDEGTWARDPEKFVCNGPFRLSQYSNITTKK